MVQEDSSFATSLNDSVSFLNGYLTDVLILVLLATGAFFTLATGLVQVRLFARSVKEMLWGRQDPEDPHGITPFQAFVTGLASRVGVGNIAGVALAISLGGAGAVFWMWVTALVGMSSAFAESSLAQLFKIRDHSNGHFLGGPAYYIQRGLRARWLGIVFALALILCYGFVFNMVQANSLANAANKAWGTQHVYSGLFVMLLTLPIIFGGIRRVSKIAEAIVPVMALLYLLMTFYIIFMNLPLVPVIIHDIFVDAFNVKAAAGGIFGGIFSQAMVLGVQRGLFSNEAGMGSAPNAAASADVKHPASQGMIQMLGVFVDTFVICTCTAVMILISRPYTLGEEGVTITQTAIVNQVGSWGADFLAIILFLFAFSTIVGNYAYAESNIRFIRNNALLVFLFRISVLVTIYIGSVIATPMVWNMADLSMSIMALINLVAILLLSPFVFIILRDYQRQLKNDIHEPIFNLDKYPKLAKLLGRDIW
ncbi:alanine/glycine:cation symporter family protein [Basilea psittacipulmonis]|uniref:Sodium:alanine symporter n=1 Tax=Basilea psittacipulmonis DSM 24701 TaxID=1072685 RepID=A0A077DE33_9BURK|nr:alanine/glycine:cation symporter family protein [Basilea psittacipulmonis]AIL32924.1 sodium:alanine symporter [Basilea psittacipulmonis DSM 24701]